MSNLTGLPPSPLTRAGMQTATQDIAVRIVQLPGALQNNTTPQKVLAQVIGQNPDGAIKLQTDQGTVAIILKDRASLPVGMKIEIDIPAGKNPSQATIRSAETPQTQSTQAQTLTSAAPNIINSAASSLVNAGVKLDRLNTPTSKEMQEILAAAKNDGTAMPAKPATINIGETIKLTAQPAVTNAPSTAPHTEAEMIQSLLTLISDNLENPQAQKLLNTLKQLPLLNMPLSNNASTPNIQNLQNQMQALLNKVGSLPSITTTAPINDGMVLPRSFEAKIISILPLSISSTMAPPQSLTPQQNAPILLARLEGTDTNTNLPLFRIATPNSAPQQFTLPFPVTNINQGQSILIQPLITTDTDVNITPQTLMNFIKSGNWESLQDLLHNMNLVSPMAAGQIINQLPSLQNQAQNNPLALIFLSMLKGGEIEQWIPAQVLSILREQNKINILKTLQTDQITLNRIDTIMLNNDWKLNLFPFWHDGHVHKFPLYSKAWDEDNDTDPDKRRKKMRFLFDLTLTRMGKIQVDGFFQGSEKTPQLDMILRAEKSLSPPMQQQMKQLYTKSLERSNLNGELSFQFRNDQWVNTEDMIPII